MNTSNAQPAPKHAPVARRVGGNADERSAEDFERALRDKQKDTGDEPALLLPPPRPMPSLSSLPAPDAPEPAPAATPLAAGPLPMKPPELSIAPLAPRGQPAVEAPTRPAQLDLSPALAPGSDAARAFEVSVNEPLGVSLSLRAVQPVAQAGGVSRWALSIGSTNLNPAALKRNTGRLEARLRSRALSDETVRIEHDDPPP
jgi:hypothetical protein